MLSHFEGRSSREVSAGDGPERIDGARASVSRDPSAAWPARCRRQGRLRQRRKTAMRLVDVLLRQGHLSERALVDAIMTGDRPVHLDRCDICAVARGGAESLARQRPDGGDRRRRRRRFRQSGSPHSRRRSCARLEQLDEPARVIAFPRQARPDAREAGRRRVAPGWLGVAAAVGLVVGVDWRPGQRPCSATRRRRSAVAASGPRHRAGTANRRRSPTPPGWIRRDVDGYMPASLGALNEATPASRRVPSALADSRRQRTQPASSRRAAVGRPDSA